MKRTSLAAAFILAAAGALAGPRTRPANAAATRPATQPAKGAKLDLDATVKLLTKRVGGKWQKGAHNAFLPTKRVVRGYIYAATDKVRVSYTVYPLELFEGKSPVLSTLRMCGNAEILGVSPACVVTVFSTAPADKVAPYSKAVTKALGLKPPKVTRRSRELKADIRNFVLRVWYYGPKDKGRTPYRWLTLLHASGPRPSRAFPDGRFVNITERQAEKIIDHLAAEGFLSRAGTIGEKANVVYKGPAYFMTVPTGTKRLEATLGWGPEMLARLDALRKVLDGDAAKAMDGLLKRLAAQNLEWKWKKHTLPVGPRLLLKILSVRQVVRGGYTFIAICEALNEPQAVSDATGAYQKFKVHACLDGTPPAGKTFNLNYHYYAYSSPPERPVRKGEKVIWIVSKRADPYKGVRVLAYTPENHKAVDEAVLVERYAGKAVNGLKLTLRAAKATTAMRPDGRSAEPVPLAFTFANVGDKPIKLETSDHLWPRLDLHVTGPNGKSVRITELMVERIGPVKVTYSLLKAGHSVTYSKRFPGGYFNYKSHDLLKPGAYRIWASYLSAVAVSNEITLTVKAAPAAPDLHQPAERSAADGPAAARAKLLKQHVDTFRLTLKHLNPDGPNIRPVVRLTTAESGGRVPTWNISKAQTLKLIDHLAAEGFLASSSNIVDTKAAEITAPCCVLSVGGPPGESLGPLFSG